MEGTAEETSMMPVPSPLTVLLGLSLTATAVPAAPLNLSLPTKNTAIFTNRPDEFYMYTDRTFEGVTSRPWQAGQYGFVRNMKRTEEGVIGTRFHEGIDIKPVSRDSKGNPLDDVMSIATGVVAYTNDDPAHSNYGRYVVIEHNWGDGPMFSLYAHLASISASEGQRVLGGTTIGRMGFTGAGLNRTRAHLHLELGLLFSLRFQHWHDGFLSGPNHHGIHNGLNLTGLDIASLYQEQRRNPGISIPAFLRSTPAYYKVTTARKGPLEIVERYPWLRRGDHAQPSPSWEISFTASGLPLSVTPSHRVVNRPTVTYVRSTRSRHEYFTIRRLVGTGSRASLTGSGERHLRLVTGDFPNTAPKESEN
jgi:murein DD-endopeptidase MepM/ murein hydrolase activator NlpD